MASLHSAVEREIYGGRAAELAGISPEAMGTEVKKELRRRFYQEKKKQERKDLTPAAQLQPKERGLRYENIRSARGGGGGDPADAALARSVPAGGRAGAGAVFLPAAGKGIPSAAGALAAGAAGPSARAWRESLSGDEMSHLASIADQPESSAHGGQALSDYIEIIETEGLKRSGQGTEALLRAAQKRYKENKSYGGS